jgi:hypothetical protein
VGLQVIWADCIHVNWRTLFSCSSCTCSWCIGPGCECRLYLHEGEDLFVAWPDCIQVSLHALFSCFLCA